MYIQIQDYFYVLYKYKSWAETKSWSYNYASYMHLKNTTLGIKSFSLICLSTGNRDLASASTFLASFEQLGEAYKNPQLFCQLTEKASRYLLGGIMKHFLTSPLSFVIHLTMAFYLLSNYFCINHFLLSEVWKFGTALQSQISATPT